MGNTTVLSGLLHNANPRSIPRSPSTAYRKLKLLLVGDEGVGKTCLARRIIKHDFVADPPHTTRVDINLKYIADNIPITLEIWDTPVLSDSAERILSLYLKDVDGVFVVTDSTNPVSFKQLGVWTDRIKKYQAAAAANWTPAVPIADAETQGELQDEEIFLEGYDVKRVELDPATVSIPLVLMVNKSDHSNALMTEQEVHESASAFAMKHGFLCSASRGVNVLTAVQHMIEAVFEARLQAIKIHEAREDKQPEESADGQAGYAESPKPLRLSTVPTPSQKPLYDTIRSKASSPAALRALSIPSAEHPPVLLPGEPTVHHHHHTRSDALSSVASLDALET